MPTGMQHSGEYPQPLQRVTNVQVPLVSGYATARLNVQLAQTGTGTNQVLPDNAVAGLVENTGDVAATVTLLQCGNYVSGPRIALGTPVLLAPKGRAPYNFTPKLQYVEIWCGGGGPSTLRAQFTSQLIWSLMAFAKNDPTYPPQLWQPTGGYSIT